MTLVDKLLSQDGYGKTAPQRALLAGVATVWALIEVIMKSTLNDNSTLHI